MKKKEVTWADFGENDKITEEVLGLKRVPKNIYVKDSYSLGTIVAFLFLILDFVIFSHCPQLFYLCLIKRMIFRTAFWF